MIKLLSCLPPKFKRRTSYYKFCLLIYLFFSACNGSEIREKTHRQISERAEKFLNELLFVEGGCYTLFGDKPMTSMLLYHGKVEPYLKNLSPEALKSLQYVDLPDFDCYLAWKFLTKNQHFEKFAFVELPVENDPSCTLLCLMNVPLVKKIISNHQFKFQQVLLTKNCSSLIEELKKPNTKLWSTLMKDHYLAGLLYGYGEENCRSFCLSKKRVFSVGDFKGKIDHSNFPIPSYHTSENDQTSEKYRMQAKKIKKRFHKKNLFKVTLNKLLSKSI